MSSSKHFTETVRAWAEVFLHRSLRDFGHFAREAGLSLPQVNTLMRLYYKPPCGVSDIGDFLSISNAAASQMVERLVQQGLLERTEYAGDRRIKQLTLTAKGRALVEKALEHRLDWLAALPANLSPEQQTTIVTALTCLTEAAQKLAEAEGRAHPAKNDKPCAPVVKLSRAARPRQPKP